MTERESALTIRRVSPPQRHAYLMAFRPILGFEAYQYILHILCGPQTAISDAKNEVLGVLSSTRKLSRNGVVKTTHRRHSDAYALNGRGK